MSGTWNAQPVLDHYRVQGDVSPADWLVPRLSIPPYRRVDGLLPSGLAAYARLLHPARDGEGRLLRWSDVAAAIGHRMHAMVQWNELVTAPWQRGQEAQQGNVPWVVLGPLAEHLRGATAHPEDVWLCLWEGWGWLHGSPSVSHLGSSELIPPALGQEVLASPRVQLPWRNYLLFQGPLGELSRWGHFPMPSQYPDWFEPQSPSLIWPQETTWCVATEVDFESTYVGGPQALISELLEDPRLEAWPVEPTDVLVKAPDAGDAST